jgi:hypothetical protein
MKDLRVPGGFCTNIKYVLRILVLYRTRITMQKINTFNNIILIVRAL